MQVSFSWNGSDLHFSLGLGLSLVCETGGLISHYNALYMISVSANPRSQLVWKRPRSSPPHDAVPELRRPSGGARKRRCFSLSTVLLWCVQLVRRLSICVPPAAASVLICCVTDTMTAEIWAMSRTVVSNYIWLDSPLKSNRVVLD